MRTHLALIVIMMMWGTVASADGRVGVVVTGDANIQPQLAAKLEGWLRQQGHQLVPSPLPADKLNTLIDCFVIEDLACAQALVEEHAASEMVVFAKVESGEGDGGKRNVTLTVHWFERGEQVVTDRQTCEACTDEALRATAELIMASLAAKGDKDVGTMQLTSIPSGARVLVDGKEVGVTPLTYAVSPGNHTISIVHDHHRGDARTVMVRKAETTAIDVRLEPDRPRSRMLPVGLIAGGGALLVGGVIAFAASEEDDGSQYEYTDTRPLGIVLGLAGLAAAGAGTYLYLKWAPKESAPSVAFVSGGAVLGWSGRF